MKTTIIGLLGFLIFFCAKLFTHQLNDTTDTKNFYGSQNASQYGSSDEFWNDEDDEILEWLGVNQEVNGEDFDSSFNIDISNEQDEHAAIVQGLQGQEAINELTTNINENVQINMISPFNKSTSTSPVLNPRYPTLPFDKIVFLHMRKAGGTSIRKYFQRVSTHYNISFHHLEGPKNFEITSNTTLYVTNIREPLARSISNFKYSKRWSCQDLNNKSFVPTLQNTINTLDTFIDSDIHPKKDKRRVWDCAVNCYIRWLTSEHKAQDVTNNTLQQAQEVLSKFHVVIVLEWLKDPKYLAQIEGMFGLKGLGRKGIPFCAGVSAKANELYPLEISNETMKHLKETNALDTLLYENAMLNSQSSDAIIPSFNRSKFNSAQCKWKKTQRSINACVDEDDKIIHRQIGRKMM